MLLCLQVEKYLSTGKWVIQEGELDIDDKLLQLIGMAMGVKFGGLNFLTNEEEVDDCVSWAKEVYGEVYYSKVGREMNDDSVISYWRSAEQILRPDQTYDECYLEHCRRLLGSFFGCELFDVKMGVGLGGKGILLGINETGLLFFDKETKVLEEVRGGRGGASEASRWLRCCTDHDLRRYSHSSTFARGGM